MIDEHQWITVPQAASLLDLRKRTVKRWVRSGRLQSWRDLNGNLGVSLKDVENLRQELFTEQQAVPAPNDQDEPAFERQWNFSDATADDTMTMGRYESEEPEEQTADEESVESVETEPAQDFSTPEPETVSAQSTPRDPLSVLEHQAERSIQVAGAAFHEAKELAVAYREELQAARQEHRVELHRVRRNGNVAWTLVAAAVLLILGGAWFIGQQFGDQKLYETQVSHLTERLDQTSSENQDLQTRIETLKTESAGVASELRTARLGHADAVGQLAAFRAHAGQLTHQIRVLETQIQKERAGYRQALEKTKQRAVQTERNRLALIRQEQAERAERERQAIAAKARAQREAAQRQQEQKIRAQQQREEQQRRAALAQQQAERNAIPPSRNETLARLDERVRMCRRQNAKANLTLTELEDALTLKK